MLRPAMAQCPRTGQSPHLGAWAVQTRAPMSSGARFHLSLTIRRCCHQGFPRLSFRQVWGTLRTGSCLVSSVADRPGTPRLPQQAWQFAMAQTPARSASTSLAKRPPPGYRSGGSGPIVHHVDLPVSVSLGNKRDAASVRRPAWVSVQRRVIGQAGLARAVRVHHVDLFVPITV